MSEVSCQRKKDNMQRSAPPTDRRGASLPPGEKMLHQNSEKHFCLFQQNSNSVMTSVAKAVEKCYAEEEYLWESNYLTAAAATLNKEGHHGIQ